MPALLPFTVAGQRQILTALPLKVKLETALLFYHVEIGNANAFSDVLSWMSPLLTDALASRPQKTEPWRLQYLCSSASPDQRSKGA